MLKITFWKLLSSLFHFQIIIVASLHKNMKNIPFLDFNCWNLFRKVFKFDHLDAVASKFFGPKWQALTSLLCPLKTWSNVGSMMIFRLNSKHLFKVDQQKFFQHWLTYAGLAWNVPWGNVVVSKHALALLNARLLLPHFTLLLSISFLYHFRIVYSH